MTISVTCENGHKLKAKDSHAGRSLACPACGATVVVPPAAAAQADLTSLDDPAGETPPGFSDDLFSAEEVATPQIAAPAQPQLRAPRPAATTPVAAPAAPGGGRNFLLLLFAGGAIGGSVLGVLLILVFWLAFGGPGGEITPDPAMRDAQAAADAASVEPSPPNSPTPSSAEVAGAGETPPATAAPEATRPGATDSAAQQAVAQPPATPPRATRPDPTEDLRAISRKLRQIGLAFHNFHDTYRQFAPTRSDDVAVVNPGSAGGQQLTGLSWRVHLLPFLDQGPLYQQFHLDEPWDSPHNKALAVHMPEVYRIGSAPDPTTRFQVINGPEMLFGSTKPPRLREIRDGSRHTILAIITGPDRAVSWTQPDTLTLDPQDPLAALGTLPDKLIMCVMCDAQALMLYDDIAPGSFLALATPHGSEIIDAESFRRQFEEDRWDALENKARQLAAQGGSSASPASPGASPLPTPTTLSAARQLAITKERSEKLKRLVLAMHNYHDTYRQMPPAKNQKNFDQDGKPFLSWRVHLLPFLDQGPLYQQFKQDEPWDSPHNMALLDKMPEVLRDPADDGGGTSTRYVTLTGPETCFSKPDGPRLRDMTDGTSNTLLIVAAGTDKRVPWTKPVDVVFDPNEPVACLGTIEEPGIFYARADGAVKVVKREIPPELFKMLVTPAGGERPTREFANFEVR